MDIRVIIPKDKEFEKYEPRLLEMYQEAKGKIADTNDFDFVKERTLFYTFVNRGFSPPKLLGGIYYYKKGGKLYFNAFSGRKQHAENLECLKMTLNWFKCDIFANSQNKMSAYCLLKCGFERIGNSNIFVYRKNERITI